MSNTSAGVSLANLGMKTEIGIGLLVVLAARNRHVGLGHQRYHNKVFLLP